MPSVTQKMAATGNVAAEVRYMIVVMGGGGVGKSCLTFRLVHKEFLEVYDPTVEDFYRKANFMVDDEICPIEIMDTAGQDEFAAMRDLYYKKGHGFLFVFSLIDSSSVNDVKERFDSLLAARGVSIDECPPIIVVGNKCDLENERVVSRQEGELLARSLGPKVNYVETSAKSNINVEMVFEDIVRNIRKDDLDRLTAAHMHRKSKKVCCII